MSYKTHEFNYTITIISSLSPTADCTWDYFGCTRRSGRWPANKPCCQQRFDGCCMYVMGKKNGNNSSNRPANQGSHTQSSSLGQGNGGGYGPAQSQVVVTNTPAATTPRPTTTTTRRTTTTTRRPVPAGPNRPGYDQNGKPVQLSESFI